MNMPRERDKHAWRIEILTRRNEMTAAQHAAEATALVAAVADIALPEVVCAYVPTSSEPGTVDLLDALRARAKVLLPVTGPPGPLHWAQYTGQEQLRAARFGIREPSGPVMGPEAVRTAGLVLVPALAVDQRGVRLGRGAGYYDRTLSAPDVRARLVAVVRDDEVVARLPHEPHDVRMGWVLTPGAGLRELSV